MPLEDPHANPSEIADAVQTGTLRTDKPNSIRRLTGGTVRLRLTVRNGPLVQSRGNIDSERRSAIWRQFLADSDIRTVLALTS